MSESAGSVQLLDGELQSGWNWALLGELCTVRRGASPRPAGDPRYFGGVIPWFKIGDATAAPGRHIEFTEDTVNELGASLSVRIPKGSLIVANSGVSLGFPRITGVDGCIHDGWLYLRDFRGVSRDYLYYFFLHITQALRTFASGTTQPNLNTDIAKRLRVPLPPLSEQESIVEILSTLDDKIEVDRRLNQSLEDLASSLFQSWFVDFDPVVANRDGTTLVGVPSEATNLFPCHFADSELGPIPQGWRLVSLSELAELNATTLSAKGIPSAIHYIEISDVHRGDVDRITTYPRGAEPSRARRALRHGDTVVSAVRPERGAYFLCLDPPENLVASTGFVVLTPRSTHWALIYCAATSEDALDHYERHAEGGAYPAMRPDVVGALRLALPIDSPLRDLFCSVVHPVLQQAHANRAEMKTLAELRDTLLGPLLLGELTVKSAEKALGAAL